MSHNDYSAPLESEFDMSAVNYEISTEENYMDPDAEFVGEYSSLRQSLDYSYHKRYSERRQLFHDTIINRFRSTVIYDGDVVCERPERNWLVFTAGCMGSGKSHTLSWLSSRDLFPLWSFVRVDFDGLRDLLPETAEYQRREPSTAGYLTQKEVGYIAEVLTLTALQEGKNIIVDGTLRDYDWYAQYMSGLRYTFPSLKLAIFHVTVSPVTAQRRAQMRAKVTGRVVPMELILETMEKIPRAIEELSPYADFVCTFRNEETPELIYTSTGDLSLTGFRDQWHMTCSVDSRSGYETSSIKGREQDISLLNVFQYDQCAIL
mmetsp:Transcript_10418/g.15844  ORF Transcript_10418/g.15844 Transcript_10418/m.15844 type:complete len:319 (+) Transcript_10418:216-1172(+)|eukprot:CAMPEP_0185040312 /NCGR_PEP_ID=MMETSP1103-20130426/38220_1 /TAXON_ID=36769 /ORGANISM="Paraphysomonas bandaiensis, Strain Caron Lab Isolate" /LENGTH=318 /DNA_ID=CAMNT_0027579561 /DNA_START=204 /DNA_END=1160 /DNA_ORIENTATION=-